MNRTTLQTFSVSGMGLLALAFLTACSHRPQEIPPPVEPMAEYSTEGEVSMQKEWWRAFDSPELDVLVARGLQSNLDLREALERLQEARALVDRESASFWPTLNAEAAGTRIRPESISGDDLELGLFASYEVDLWGRVRSSVQAQSYRAAASEADYQTAALTLSAEITQTWLALFTARQQLRLLSSQLEVNERVLSLLQNRFESGQISRVDLLRQRQLVEETREQYYRGEAREKTVAHQLAVLLGETPDYSLAELPTSFPDLPPLPQTGLPSELVQRRPDIRAAYSRLLAADRALAAAVRNRLPRLSLTAGYSTEDNNTTELFDDWIRTLAANLIAPVIDGGQRRAEVRRVEAVKRQRLYAYGQATLEAFREVEDALVRESRQKARLKSLQEQVRYAQESYEQLRREYINGITDYLDVLTALTSLQQLQRDLLDGQLALFEFRIALYRALAGALPETGHNPSE